MQAAIAFANAHVCMQDAIMRLKLGTWVKGIMALCMRVLDVALLKHTILCRPGVMTAIVR